MSLLEEQSVRSAELETSIRVLRKDIIEIEAERKAVLKARTAAQEAGDAATVTALTQKSSELLQEGTTAINQLGVYEAEKISVDGQISRLQLQAQQEAQAGKAPVPVSNESNPSGIPTGPTSTITEGNRNSPLPVNEFDGIDAQVADNENGLQEPPLLTDEEVNQQIEDTIAEQKFEDSFVDDATGVDAAVAQQKFEDSFVDDATGVDEQVAEQKTINENTTGQAVVAEDGTINPNIKINPETGELYVPVGDAGIDDQIRKQAEERRVESTNPNQGGASSNKTALRNTQAAQTEQTAQKFKAQEDWRVRLSLAPGATYLYKVGQGAAGILNPLQATDGVIFPYTPAISVSYSAGYDSTDVTHSNYKFFSYKNSNVDNVTITADFTAQDTAEAQYLLAVIHFFRSVTKMFYGKDPGPGPGVPPPLCYLNGLGSFQFDWHPLVINNFTYTLPTDVDYIRAMDTASRPGVNVGSGQPKGKSGEDPAAQRMAGGRIQTGALAAPPQFKNDSGNKDAVTYVPTKMSIAIQAYPIVSRNDVSNNFSLKEYATGKLLRGSQRQSGGFW